MNKYLLFSILFSFILITSKLQANEGGELLINLIELDTIPEPKESEAFKVVEYMPHFVGCEKEEDRDERSQCSNIKIIEFINKNIKYPEEARIKGIEGTPVVRFVVEKDGKLTFNNKSILRNPGGGLGEEALRVIKSMPNWIPGRLENEPVRVTFTLPIKFQLTDNVEEIEKPKFEDVTVKWDGVEIKGTTEREDPYKYVKATCELDTLKKILSIKSNGMPLYLKYKGDSKGFTQYYATVGKNRKKLLISSYTKNKGLKKKLLKALKSGETVYFFNWEYKKTILEILVK